jgi:hypothetical protein
MAVSETSSAMTQTRALYQPDTGTAELPTEVLWNNGSTWSWDGARIDMQTYLGSGGLTLGSERSPAKAKDGALHLSADAACPRGCNVEVLRLVLPVPVDPGAYLKAGHLQLEVKRNQPMLGSLVFGFGSGETSSQCSVRLDFLPQGTYRHISLALPDFKPHFPAGAPMTIPFQLSVKDAQYPAGPLLSLKFIRWTPE